jgi:hypothetical protein
MCRSNANFRIAYVWVILLFLFLPFRQYAGDSLYYVKYNDRLVVAFYQSFIRQYDIAMSQHMTRDNQGVSDMRYYADANQVSGLEFDYDKFSLAFNYKSTPSSDYSKGKTTYRNLNFTFGATRWILETSYRKYQGFYDTEHRSPVDNDMYFIQPGMINQAFRAKFFYFTNHRKFAYKAAYTCTYRQLKTAASFVLAANLYSNNLYSGTSFFHPDVMSFYGTYAALKGQRVIGLSNSAGVALNLVMFKRIFLNMTLIGGLESQWRRYSYRDRIDEKGNYIGLSGDFRFSFGYNGRNFFLFFNSMSDIASYGNRQLDIVNKFYSYAFNMGYRFKVKTPKFYQEFQATRIYKMI